MRHEEPSWERHLRQSQEAIAQKIQDAARQLGGQAVRTQRGVPRVIFNNVYFGGTSVVWFQHARLWRVFEPDPSGHDGQRRTDFRTLDEVESHLNDFCR